MILKKETLEGKIPFYLNCWQNLIQMDHLGPLSPSVATTLHENGEVSYIHLGVLVSNAPTGSVSIFIVS